MSLLKKHKKELERIYKEVYSNAYKKASASEFQKEIDRINKKAKSDARKAAAKNVKYNPKKSGGNRLSKAAKSINKHGKKIAKKSKKFQKHHNDMLDEIMGW